MTFEQIKNSKALAWTVLVHGILLLLFLLVKYQTYTSPSLEDFNLELVANLGTSDNGLGIDQPELMGDPAPPEAAASAESGGMDNPLEESATSTSTDVDQDDVVATENPDAAPVLRRTANPRPSTATNNRTTTRTTPTNTRATNRPTRTQTSNSAGATSTAAQPKYTYAGGTGTGGNSASQNRAGGNEGIGTGDGDMGTPGGSPTGLSYSGGVNGRTIVARPSNAAEFRNGGRVAIKVWVDRNGNITRYNILSAANSTIRSIADQKIKAVRFNKAPNAPVEQSGTIYLNFKAGTGR